jgi:[acyl-carrier-protein] S-malonyltransferase
MYTFLFPGQGSQTVGMGKDLYNEFPCAKKRMDEANSILGRDLLKIIFEGPIEDLTATQNTQPSLFTIEAAITDVLAHNGIKPTYTAGHSLGQWSALYGAGLISFEDGLKAVAKRGELMANAGKEMPGTMAAIIGLDRVAIAEVLKSVTSGIVVPANENSPEQTVISGEIAAVNEACEKLKAAGAKRAMLLPVSGAFHSPLMQKAADIFAGIIDSITFSNPICALICNVSGKPENDASTIKQLLKKQLISPVRWVDSIASLAGLDYGTCLETGPGAVLKGLVKKCNETINVVPSDTVTNIYSLLNKN